MESNTIDKGTEEEKTEVNVLTNQMEKLSLEE